MISSDEKKLVLRRLQRAIEAQFAPYSGYSWNVMINELGFSPEAAEWATRHTFPKVGYSE